MHRISFDDNDYEKSHQVIQFPESNPKESIGAIALTKDNDIVLVCGKFGVATGSFKSGEINYFLKYPHTESQQTRLRSNDGIVDPWGHLWIGVMTDFPTSKKEGVCKEGFLYRIDCNTLAVTTMARDVYIPNGLAFSEDGTKFFWTDSLTFTLWQFDYDHETNVLSNKQPLMEFREILPEEESPEPDGMNLTASGHFYQPVFTTKQVVEFTADKKVHSIFNIPAKGLTCVAVGGPNDDEVYFTTAHLDHEEPDCDNDANVKTGDLGGYLFRIKLDKKLHGKTKNLWGGEIP